jgi:hypothetical protein
MLVGVVTVSMVMYFWLFDSYRREVKLSRELYTEWSSTAVVSSVDKDADCIFRDSSIYRKVFVYPSPNEPEWADALRTESSRSLLTDHGRNASAMKWPWLEMDAGARANERGHYNIHSSQNLQYTSELLVRELMVNPKSCLRTYDPEEAELFYVPYLPSTEHHVGDDRKLDYSASPYGKAILEILDKQNYEIWETTFGLTSKYWKRRGGSDHILVFSEPMHGLYHPMGKRGHHHFIYSQKQLTPPIVLSIELSATFVQQYPQCSRKNILLPYPNTHGGWYNGEHAIPSTNRTISQYYSAGLHGTCTKLRKSLQSDYRSCSPSYRTLQEQDAMPNWIGMRKSIFCPSPVRFGFVLRESTNSSHTPAS